MANKYAYEIRPKAEKDLEKISDYISEELYNPEAAKTLMEKFLKAFRRISEFPFSCPEGQTENKYRKLIVDKYIGFYKIFEESKRVVIYRVLYGMMDYDKYL